MTTSCYFTTMSASPSALNSRHHSPEPSTPRPESETEYSDSNINERFWQDEDDENFIPENQEYYERNGLPWPFGERHTVNSPSQPKLDEGVGESGNTESQNQQLVIRT